MSEDVLRYQINRPLFQKENFNILYPISPQLSYRDRLRRNWNSFKNEFSHVSDCKKRSFNFISYLFPCISWLSVYNCKDYLLKDIIAGFTVAFMHIPQGMAYVALVPLPPVYGLYTSFFPVIIYAIFGTSRYISLGTYAVVSIMLGSAIARYDSDTATNPAPGGSGLSLGDDQIGGRHVEIALSITALVGIIELGLGLMHVGFVTTYMSTPVVRGFTTGAAMHVFTSQLNELFGIRLPRREGIGKLIKVLIGAGVSYVLNLNGHGIGIVGDIPEGMPSFQLPTTKYWLDNVGRAFAIATVAIFTSFSMAKILGEKHGDEINPNKVAGLVSCVLLLAVILKIGSIFKPLPSCVLSSIIVVALRGMFYQLADIGTLYRRNKTDLSIFLVTLLSTALLDVDIGLAVGIIFALLTLVVRTQRPTICLLGRLPGTDIYVDLKRYKQAQALPGIKIYSFQCFVYYANANKFRDNLYSLCSISHAKQHNLQAFVRKNPLTPGELASSDHSNKMALNPFLKPPSTPSQEERRKGGDKGSPFAPLVYANTTKGAGSGANPKKSGSSKWLPGAKKNFYDLGNHDMKVLDGNHCSFTSQSWEGSNNKQATAAPPAQPAKDESKYLNSSFVDGGKQGRPDSGASSEEGLDTTEAPSRDEEETAYHEDDQKHLGRNLLKAADFKPILPRPKPIVPDVVTGVRAQRAQQGRQNQHVRKVSHTSSLPAYPVDRLVGSEMSSDLSLQKPNDIRGIVPAAEGRSSPSALSLSATGLHKNGGDDVEDGFQRTEAVVIDLNYVTFLDTVAIETLVQIVKDLGSRGIVVVMARCGDNALSCMEKGRLFNHFERRQVYLTIHDAVLALTSYA